jgi:hypothetical protein
MAVVMAAPAQAMPAMPGMGSATGVPWLTGSLALFFVADAVLNGTRLLVPSAQGYGRAVGGMPLWSRPMANACHIAMSLAMAVMLLGM